MAEINRSEWENFLAQHPEAHILQTATWGQLKAEFGWRVMYIAQQSSGAQLLVKNILPGVRFGYIPKGPVGVNWQLLWAELDKVCQRVKCGFVKIEPDLWMDNEKNHPFFDEEFSNHFVISKHSIQPMRSLVIDIRGEEQQILGQMKQKTRYNISLAIKKGVKVRPHTDLGAFYQLMEVTGQRDQFGIHSQAYYQRAFDLFSTRDQCQLLLAEFDGTPLGALIVFKHGNRAWYFYGASSNAHRERMPNYLLQWEAMRWAKSQGCEEYDLWGVPDEDLETLEANFAIRQGGLWGVYRFKRGFGGSLKRSVGSWDRVYNPVIYKVFSLWQKYLGADR